MRLARRSMLACAAAAALLMVAAGVAQARTIHVHPGQSIQKAVNSAHPGDVIALSAGTFRQNVAIHTNRLTLRGAGSGEHGTVLLAPRKLHGPCAQEGDGICVFGAFDQQGNPDFTKPVRGTTIARLAL